MYALISFLVTTTYLFTGIVLWIQPIRELLRIDRLGDDGQDARTPVWIDLIIFALSPLWLSIVLICLAIMSPIALIAGFCFSMVVVVGEAIYLADRTVYRMRNKKPVVPEVEHKWGDSFKTPPWYTKVHGDLRFMAKHQTLPPNSNVEITLAEGNFGVDLDSVEGLRIIYQSDDLVGAQVSDHNSLVGVASLPSVIRVTLS